MGVPIFDDAYRERLRQRQRMEAYFEAMRQQLGSLSAHSTNTERPRKRATLSELREDFAAGRITFEDFERRVTVEVARSEG